MPVGRHDEAERYVHVIQRQRKSLTLFCVLNLKDQSLRSDSNIKKLTSFNLWETSTGH